MPGDHPERHLAWTSGVICGGFLEEVVTEPGPENKWESARWKGAPA